MCGICGIIYFNQNSVNEDSLKQMMGAIKHRGPDDEGVFCENNLGFGFVRLSIIDLSSAGHQPMFSSDQRYIVVFNGEIYNYIEIRNELKILGYVFNTNTDTEVLLAAYDLWGEECLNRFNGMWAFAIYDRKNKTVFAARDRFGVKPFYYYVDEKQFIFASEIQPILKVLKKKVAPNKQAIFDYLVFNRTDQTEATFFNGIKKLQHGYQLTINNCQLSITKWYDLRGNLKQPFHSPEEFNELFNDSIGLRLRSDVAVGVSLSGGIDSSSIVSVLLKNFNKRDLNSFSAVYGKGNKGDESEFIFEYDEKLKQMHFTYPSAETLQADIHNFIKAHGEPIPTTGPYAQFKVMELAKQKVVVILDGQGADEQLAGYHYFFGFFFKDLLKNAKIIKLTSEIIHYIVKHRSIYGIKSWFYFMLPKSLRTWLRVKEKGYLHPKFLNEFKTYNGISENIYGSLSLHDALLDHFEFKLEHLLKWEDRNSMWFSIESRVPFLDYRLVERTLSLAAADLIRKGMTKFYLREAMKGILPEKIRLRKDKIGFLTPEDQWFRTLGFQSFVNDLLSSESFRNRGFINVEMAKHLYSLHITGKINISKEIWKWINLELWFREFIDEYDGIIYRYSDKNLSS